MKHAILILAHRNFNHLQRLLDCFDEKFSFYIHIDKENDFAWEEIKYLQEHPRVVYCRADYNIHWGSSLIVKSILKLIKEVLKDNSISYAHLISGQDYLVGSCIDFVSFFNKHNGSEFLEHWKLPTDRWYRGGLNRIKYYYLFDLFKARTGILRRLNNTLVDIQKFFRLERQFKPSGIQLYGGSMWWSLSFECLKYIDQFVMENPDLIESFNHTFCSDEIMLQTVVMNSPFASNVINCNYRYLCWEDRNGNYPANLDESDWLKIEHSGAFFARKFQYPVSLPLLDLIDKNRT